MTLPFIFEHANGVRILLFVVPRASKTSVEGVHDDRLRVRVAAPPVDGEANKEIVRFFANLFDVAKSDVSIEQGSTGRRKTLEVSGRSVPDILNALGL